MKKNFLIACFTALILTIIPFKDYAGEAFDEELKLYLGRTESITINNPTRVSISDPNIADITRVTKSELVVTPKALGSTTLVIRDTFGEQYYRIVVLAEDLPGVQSRIDHLIEKLNLPGVYTDVAEEENRVLLLGTVKSPQDRERIATALEQLKDKFTDLVQVKEEETVVDIDVQVLEINRGAAKTLGFTMPTSVSAAETPDRFSKVMRGSLDAIFHVFDWPRNSFSARIDALVQEGKARILSRPRLACQSGKEAELLVGGEKPIFTTEVASAGGEGTSVEYKEYGIKLNIKPVVTDKKQIKLSLKMEVSEPGTAEYIGSASDKKAMAYPFTKRNASTELFMDNEQTLAIGGLIKRKTQEVTTKTAGLGDIPIIGLFFRNKTSKTGDGQDERADTELFITLTPTIITGKEEVNLRPAKKKITSGNPDVSVNLGTNLLASLERYKRNVQKRITNNLTYPESAKEAHFQGTAKLSLLLSRQGELLDVKVNSTSGYQSLDDNAVSVARNISSYPPFPADIAMEELWIEVPISYQLD